MVKLWGYFPWPALPVAVCWQLTNSCSGNWLTRLLIKLLKRQELCKPKNTDTPVWVQWEIPCVCMWKHACSAQDWFYASWRESHVHLAADKHTQATLDSQLLHNVRILYTYSDNINQKSGVLLHTARWVFHMRILTLSVSQLDITTLHFLPPWLPFIFCKLALSLSISFQWRERNRVKYRYNRNLNGSYCIVCFVISLKKYNTYMIVAD